MVVAVAAFIFAAGAGYVIVVFGFGAFRGQEANPRVADEQQVPPGNNDGVGQIDAPAVPSDTAPSPGPVALIGEISCLPHRNLEGPQTMECAIGFLGGDRNYYALKGLNTFEEDLQIEQRLQLFGTFSMNPTDPIEIKYNVAGTIQVETFQKLGVQ